MTGNPPVLTDPALGEARHGFFSRVGGVSDGLYGSLNVGLGSADDPGKVTANRRIVADCLGVDDIVTGRQTHGADVAEVFTAQDKPRADALFTRQKGLALGVVTADCVPVLLAAGATEKDGPGIAATVHAGWKGAGAGIIENLVETLKREKAPPASLTAVIGPAISQSSYEVGTDVYEKITQPDPDARALFHPAEREGHYFFNLPLFVHARLRAAGVERISRMDVCTYQNLQYYSHRRAAHLGEADYGRQISAIVCPD